MVPLENFRSALGSRQVYCFIFSECKSYTTLNSSDRKETHKSSYPHLCDKNLKPGWFRFQGDAGTKMPTWCIPAHRCGTDIPGWLNGIHPGEDQGIVTRQVRFRWRSNCQYWSVDIQVKNCGGYYVDYLRRTGICNAAYCGTD